MPDRPQHCIENDFGDFPVSYARWWKLKENTNLMKSDAQNWEHI
jgi:hypothetical protein